MTGTSHGLTIIMAGEKNAAAFIILLQESSRMVSFEWHCFDAGAFLHFGQGIRGAPRASTRAKHDVYCNHPKHSVRGGGAQLPSRHNNQNFTNSCIVSTPSQNLTKLVYYCDCEIFNDKARGPEVSLKALKHHQLLERVH